MLLSPPSEGSLDAHANCERDYSFGATGGLLTLETIGHYRITALIGKGGMGEVYRALDTKLDRDVAIKSSRRPWPMIFDRTAHFVDSV